MALIHSQCRATVDIIHFPNFLIFPMRNSAPLNTDSPFLLPISPWKPLVYFLSLEFCLRTSCKWNQTILALV